MPVRRAGCNDADERTDDEGADVDGELEPGPETNSPSVPAAGARHGG
jgi:hypothetical protein